MLKRVWNWKVAWVYWKTCEFTDCRFIPWPGNLIQILSWYWSLNYIFFYRFRLISSLLEQKNLRPSKNIMSEIDNKCLVTWSFATLCANLKTRFATLSSFNIYLRWVSRHKVSCNSHAHLFCIAVICASMTGEAGCLAIIRDSPRSCTELKCDSRLSNSDISCS